jgi:prolyl-tRNA editing enzyme YbaK/EbsC (Cys-tRNA(Pro) deacylase)
MNPSAPNNDSVSLSSLKMRLDAAGIAYTILVHKQNISLAKEGPRFLIAAIPKYRGTAAFREGTAQSGLGNLSAMAPAFILRTETGYLAAVIRGDTRLSYKKIKRKLGLKNVSLAAPDQVRQLTGSDVGHVALVNPGLKTIVDARVTEVETIYGGTGVPNHTLQINPRDVVTITQAQVFDFAEPKEQDRPEAGSR